jgi:hypothetical protein
MCRTVVLAVGLLMVLGKKQSGHLCMLSPTASAAVVVAQSRQQAALCFSEKQYQLLHAAAVPQLSAVRAEGLYINVCKE